MLSLMRRKAGSWVIKIILGAIVVVFVFWGVGSFHDQGQAHVATINGKPITIEEYRETYGNLLEQMRQRFGGNLTPEIIEMLQLRKQALDQLIDQRLLQLEARNMGLTVSDQELANSIAGYPVFQNNGVFDPQLYQRVLAANRLTSESFETMQRDTLLLDKVRMFVINSVKVSDIELQEWHQWRNAAVRFDYVLFAPADFPDVAVTPQAIEAHYNENSSRYMSEPKRRIRYLRFDAADYSDQVTVSETEIEAYYNENRAEFSQPATVEARHILLRVTPEADAAEVDAVHQRANELADRLHALENFEELARQYSDDPGRDGAGYLGYFERKEMVEPFAEAAFAMNPGEISQPVRTQFGWHIIRVENVRPAQENLLDDVRDDIHTRLVNEAARRKAFEAAEDTFLQSFDDDDLSLIASARALALFETDFFSRNAPSPDLPQSAQLAGRVFEMPLMDISDVLETEDGFLLLQVLEALPAEVMPLAEVEARVTDNVRHQMQEQAALAAAEDFSEALHASGNLANTAQAHNYTVNSTDFFKRREAIPGIGQDPALAQAAFELTSAKPFADGPVKSQRGYYVMAFQEGRLPDANEYEAEAETLRRELLSQKQQEAYQALIAHLREKSTIVIEDADQF